MKCHKSNGWLGAQHKISKHKKELMMKLCYSHSLPWNIHSLSLNIYYAAAPAGDTVLKNSPTDAGGAGVPGSIPGSGRSPGGGNGNPLQHSCLENSMDMDIHSAVVGGLQSMGLQRVRHDQAHTRTHTHTDPGPSILHTLPRLISAARGGGCSHYSHFTDDESKASSN